MPEAGMNSFQVWRTCVQQVSGAQQTERLQSSVHFPLGLPVRSMERPETAAVLKRTVEALMERGAIVRNLENLGERSLPYKISKHKERHRRGGYFLIDLEAPPSIVSTMMDHLGRDIDVIRRAFIKHPVSKTEECSGIIPVNYEDKLIAKKK
ncbi:PREDICTED: 28S ribosomal protein S6, mitochondrial [Fulmarus glacialis]|uniref:28S ribosomal protein S6, mitochondrial n=1 Tax=Fulmarus glacialis TaxID=30455 RepID=UPI00051B225D|nr:PREDICTED: 28S ribosomal protein S6, mitochondrial [Fulmarus glacialis]